VNAYLPLSPRVGTIGDRYEADKVNELRHLLRPATTGAKPSLTRAALLCPDRGEVLAERDVEQNAGADPPPFYRTQSCGLKSMRRSDRLGRRD
jgi:hypothetical protein